MDFKSVESICRSSRSAYMELSCSGTAAKDAALVKISENLKAGASDITAANAIDVKKAREAGKDSAFIDRLKLDEKRVDKMAESVLQVKNLSDPVGRTIKKWTRPNGLEIEKIAVPIGVIGIIYEARPDVSAEASALCLKSGNSVILRGGSDAYNSNRVIVDAIKSGCESAGLDPACVQMLDDTSHEAVVELLKMHGLVDLIIPRGGEALIKMVTENSRIPVIKHYKGVCHVFVDSSADFGMAESICFNAKVQRPSVCNAMEAMLVHESIADKFLPSMLDKFKEAGVEVRGDKKVKSIAPWVNAASDDDWGREYLGLILAVKIVSSLEEAAEHINTYGSSHSDAIVTSDYSSSRKFLKLVDSSAVYVNASTRFTDGGEFGFGAEMGISTDKLHARGPMALEELTSYKYQISGSGQIRE